MRKMIQSDVDGIYTEIGFKPKSSPVLLVLTRCRGRTPERMFFDGNIGMASGPSQPGQGPAETVVAMAGSVVG